MRFGLLARNPDGQLAFAQVVEGDHRNRTERRFRWSRRGDLVMQWVWHPVSNSMGYGDGYWRRAGKRDCERVRQFIEQHK